MDQHLSPSSSLSKCPQQPRLGQDRASGCRVNPGLPHVGRDPRTGTSSCWLQGAPQQEAGDRCLSQESNPDMGIPGTTAHTCSSTSQNKKPDHRLGVDDTSTGHMALKNQPLAGTGVKLPWSTHHQAKTHQAKHVSSTPCMGSSSPCGPRLGRITGHRACMAGKVCRAHGTA